MWKSAVFAEIRSLRAICLVWRPRARRPTTWISRSVSPAGRTFHRRALVAGGLQHRGNRLRGETPGTSLVGEHLGGLSRGKRCPVRPRLGHGVIRVGRREQPRQWVEGKSPDTAVITRPVETLMMEAGRGDQPWEESGLSQYPFGVVGMQSHLLPVVPRQRTLLLPDTHRNRNSSQVMHQRGPTKHRFLRWVE